MRTLSLRFLLGASLVLVGLALFAPGSAFAQADTAAARAAYAEVNGKLATLAETRLKVRRPGMAYDNELRAWSDGGVTRKIESVARDDSGDVVVEYYFGKDRQLLFAYTAVKGWKGDKQVTTVEQRQYFEGGKMFKWLGGRENVPVAPGSPDFATEGRERLAEAAFYLKALETKAPAGTTPSAATVVVAGQAKPAAATVAKMDNGDIACYLELKDERGAVSTEMADFPLCQREKQLVGKRVALTWRVETVQSDECQGDPACRKTKKVPLVVDAKVQGAAPAPAR